MSQATKRSISHNQNIITKAFLQCSFNKQPTHLHLLAETIKLGILDRDFKIWRSEYYLQSSHMLQNWVRCNIQNHKYLTIVNKVIVQWKEGR